MNSKSKLTVLKQIYKIYDDFIRTLDLACEKYCSVCCTSNVTLTTLEGRHIVNYLISNQKYYLFRKLRQEKLPDRFNPQITINSMAQLCAEGKDFSDIDTCASMRMCPLLTTGICPIYEVRPFGCRCLVSRQPCEKNGYADIDDFILTVNTLFMQLIEHVDTQGMFGNLIDVLLFLESDDPCVSGKKNMFKIPETHLIPNQALKVLMIPPEYREKIKPILKLLQNIPPSCSVS